MSEPEIPESEEKRVPPILWVVYIVLLIWGIWSFFAYWNGSHGWLDRGYWQKLQKAAHTTFPTQKRTTYLE